MHLNPRSNNYCSKWGNFLQTPLWRRWLWRICTQTAEQYWSANNLTVNDLCRQSLMREIPAKIKTIIKTINNAWLHSFHQFFAEFAQSFAQSKVLNLIYFSLKIWQLVAKKIFLVIKLPSCTISKFYAEFKNLWIMQNIELRLSVKQLQDNVYLLQSYNRWMFSEVCSVSFVVYTLLCVRSWNTDSWGVVTKLGNC